MQKAFMRMSILELYELFILYLLLGSIALAGGLVTHPSDEGIAVAVVELSKGS